MYSQLTSKDAIFSINNLIFKINAGNKFSFRSCVNLSSTSFKNEQMIAMPFKSPSLPVELPSPGRRRSIERNWIKDILGKDEAFSLVVR